MISTEKKFIFLTASIVLEDNLVGTIIDSKKYSSIIVLSYNQLDLINFKKYSKPTLVIDLTKSEQEIFESFNDTTRNEIRRTEKNNELSFKVGILPDHQSYGLYSRFEFMQGRVPVRFKSISNTLLFSAYYGGEIISGIYVIRSGKYLRIRSIFSKRIDIEDKELYKIIGYSTRRIVWEICRWGKVNGFISLDMASVNVNNPKTMSIARFKMSFGKNLVPEYTYIYKTKWFSIFEKMVFIKLILKKIVYTISKVIK